MGLIAVSHSGRSGGAPCKRGPWISRRPPRRSRRWSRGLPSPSSPRRPPMRARYRVRASGDQRRGQSRADGRSGVEPFGDRLTGRRTGNGRGAVVRGRASVHARQLIKLPPATGGWVVSPERCVRLRPRAAACTLPGLNARSRCWKSRDLRQGLALPLCLSSPAERRVPDPLTPRSRYRGFGGCDNRRWLLPAYSSRGSQHALRARPGATGAGGLIEVADLLREPQSFLWVRDIRRQHQSESHDLLTALALESSGHVGLHHGVVDRLLRVTRRLRSTMSATPALRFPSILCYPSPSVAAWRPFHAPSSQPGCGPHSPRAQPRRLTKSRN